MIKLIKSKNYLKAVRERILWEIKNNMRHHKGTLKSMPAEKGERWR